MMVKDLRVKVKEMEGKGKERKGKTHHQISMLSIIRQSLGIISDGYHSKTIDVG